MTKAGILYSGPSERTTNSQFEFVLGKGTNKEREFSFTAPIGCHAFSKNDKYGIVSFDDHVFVFPSDSFGGMKAVQHISLGRGNSVHYLGVNDDGTQCLAANVLSGGLFFIWVEEGEWRIEDYFFPHFDPDGETRITERLDDDWYIRINSHTYQVGRRLKKRWFASPAPVMSVLRK